MGDNFGHSTPVSLLFIYPLRFAVLRRHGLALADTAQCARWRFLILSATLPPDVRPPLFFPFASHVLCVCSAVREGGVYQPNGRRWGDGEWMGVVPKRASCLGAHLDVCASASASASGLSSPPRLTCPPVHPLRLGSPAAIPRPLRSTQNQASDKHRMFSSTVSSWCARARDPSRSWLINHFSSHVHSQLPKPLELCTALHIHKRTLRYCTVPRPAPSFRPGSDTLPARPRHVPCTPAQRGKTQHTSEATYCARPSRIHSNALPPVHRPPPACYV